MIARRHCLLALGAALTGCASAPVPPVQLARAAGSELDGSPPWPPEFVSQPPSGAGRLLRLQPERSRLRVYVFRAGSLARLGHNQVIAVSRFEGWLWWPERIEGPGALAAARSAGASSSTSSQRRRRAPRATARAPGPQPCDHCAALRGLAVVV
ncbi:hypothetical protein [Roseateles sp.]|uniref:hypothetical protein n=1 Tax=Roseateles sp. TaxID=1971397 RepID=UPI00391CB9D0